MTFTPFRIYNYFRKCKEKKSYGAVLVSTGINEPHNICRRNASNPNKQLNGNIFNKVVSKVKSLFASNCVAFA